MTKNFCDLYGKPAAAHLPEMKVEFPDIKWTGSKMAPGSPNNVDGTWIPFINSRVVFELHDMPNSMARFLPDLCEDCIAELLMRMRNKLLHP